MSIYLVFPVNQQVRADDSHSLLQSGDPGRDVQCPSQVCAGYTYIQTSLILYTLKRPYEPGGETHKLMGFYILYGGFDTRR